MDKNEYEKLYPNYCRECNGWGMFKQISPNVRIWDCDCIKQRCPRCGGVGTLDRMDQCSKCGWSRDETNRGLPGSVVI